MTKRGGYSLIEVSITLAALLIMVTFCIHLSLRLAKTAVIDTLCLLQSELICLQQQALACNMSYRVNFLLDENAYQIIQSEKSITYYLPKSTLFGTLLGMNGPPSRPLKPIKQPVKFESPHPLAAIIQPTGRISSGTVYIVDASRSFMGALSITPHQVAHIRLYYVDKNSWKLLAT